MPLSASPDLSSRRRLLATAFVVTLAVWVQMVWQAPDITTSLGDTDDAMRLVMMRALLHGAGWYDQWIGRLQPPLGVYMHWSRLLDGALAAVTAALETVLPPSRAELMMRFIWPLAWIFPVTVGGLAVARNLGARSATFICAILLALDLALFVQFRPGRVDHHNIQITMTVLALACATIQGERRARWAVVCGAASALGLAIGIEALAFHALIGASFGLRLIADRKTAGQARAYGLSLALASLALYAIATPPGRWFLELCDAMGINLVATLVIAGVGLALVAAMAERASPRARTIAVALVGLVAAGVYVGLDPLCLGGPFAAVDPRVRPFWFDHIQELEPWPVLFHEHRNEAIHSMAIGAMGALAAAWLLIRGRREPMRGDWLLAACALVGVVAEAKAYRMEDYGLWFGTPAIAIALADLAMRVVKDKMLPVGLMAVALSPAIVADGVILAFVNQPKPARTPVDRCDDTQSYAALARLPAGLVLGEPDFGSFVLANTADSALSAPYHRMTWGILAAHDALAAPAVQAEGEMRALHATYVLDCPVHLLRLPPGSVGDDIRRGRAPSWLQRLSAPGQPLQIYRVTPIPPGRSRPCPAGIR
jgi:hypothetical protein